MSEIAAETTRVVARRQDGREGTRAVRRPEGRRPQDGGDRPTGTIVHRAPRPDFRFLQAFVKSPMSEIAAETTRVVAFPQAGVPTAPPSEETETTATERSLPSRARRSCSCSTSITHDMMAARK
jgi:hypothetical protein